VNLVMIGRDVNDGLGAGTSSTAMYGFGGNDNLTGGTANDWIFGGEGDDTITGGVGADHLYGGADNDTFNVGAVAHLDTGEIIDGGAGDDTIAITGSNGIYDFTVATITNVENLTGAGGNQVVYLTALQWAGFSSINLG